MKVKKMKPIFFPMPQEFRKWLEENADATKHLFNKLKAVQSK